VDTIAKDKSNIMFGQKMVEDSLILAGILPNDGWKEIDQIFHSFSIDKAYPHIVVHIQEADNA